LHFLSAGQGCITKFKAKCDIVNRGKGVKKPERFGKTKLIFFDEQLSSPLHSVRLLDTIYEHCPFIGRQQTAQQRQ